VGDGSGEIGAPEQCTEAIGVNGRPGVCLRGLALAKDFVVSLLSLLTALFAKHLQGAMVG
jgi:hypothetical protein